MPVVGRGRLTPMEQMLQDQLEEIRAGLGGQTSQPRAALTVPAYMLADLPSAAQYPNAIVRVIDNPQGTATSNGMVWLSDVDGSNLGDGNG